MTDGASTQVECPVCGESFDPTAAGGWCTNSDCGEWQYIGDEVPEPAETPSTPDGGTAAADEEAVGEDGDGKPELDLEDPNEAGDADEVEDAGAADEVEDAGAADEVEDAGAADEVEDAGAADEAAAGTAEESPAEEPASEGAVATDEDATDETTCPDCGSDVEPDANFCPSCGSDLDEDEAADADAGLDACPACGADVDADDSFCAGCGEDLEAARSSTGAEDAVATGAGADASAGAVADGEPDSLVLAARGEEIAVADGDTVGREARRILTDTGGDEDDAVLIHREHVRFVREDGDFYVVDLGDNPTAVNGNRLSKGDRQPIEPGDELELSGVVTLSVDAP